MAKYRFYAVRHGRSTGVFSSWTECETLTTGFPNSLFKGFGTRAEAEQWLLNQVEVAGEAPTPPPLAPPPLPPVVRGNPPRAAPRRGGPGSSVIGSGSNKIDGGEVGVWFRCLAAPPRVSGVPS